MVNTDMPENGESQAAKIKNKKLRFSLHRNYSKQKLKELITKEIFWIQTGESPSFKKKEWHNSIMVHKLKSIGGTTDKTRLKHRSTNIHYGPSNKNY